MRAIVHIAGVKVRDHVLYGATERVGLVPEREEEERGDHACGEVRGKNENPSDDERYDIRVM